jgi:PIN domain nuclease of toxin-antitoxin system
MAQNQIALLPLSLDHVLGVATLPMPHRDPSDRTLIAQSAEQGWPIITADP